MGTMLAIMETQKKYEHFCISKDYKYLVGMRDMQDKNGGELMVVARSRELVMERQDTSNSDILDLNVEWQGWKFKFVLVYLDTRDMERNLKIKSKMEDIVGAVD